jgi:hypothetical protein
MDVVRPVTADRTRATNPFSFAGDLEQRRSPNTALEDAFFLPIDRYPNSLKENRVSEVIGTRSGLFCILSALTPCHKLL